MGKLWMYYENVSLIDIIYPPKQKVRFAVYQAPLVSNVEVSKITNAITSLKTQIQTLQANHTQLNTTSDQFKIKGHFINK